MRFSLALILLVCVSGFVATSGMVSLTGEAGQLQLNGAALRHTLPVLIALAAPALVMGVLLSFLMLGRKYGWIAMSTTLAVAATGLVLALGQWEWMSALLRT
jgi:hypothetical protein